MVGVCEVAMQKLKKEEEEEKKHFRSELAVLNLQMVQNLGSGIPVLIVLV